MKNFKDAEIIEGIINNNTEVIEYVYNTYFPLLSYKLIKNIKLNEDDAWDIFQDTIVVVFNYLKEKEGVLNYSFNAFIYSVCKRLVSNRFRKMFNSLEEIKGFEIENISLETSKSSNYDFPENIKDYRLIIHCGACMTNRREILSRIMKAKEANIPITNYGLAIAYSLGIFERALEPFPLAKQIYEEYKN